MKKIDKNNINIKESNVIELWAHKFPEVTKWLEKAKLQAKEFSALNLFYYCYAAEKTPTELLALKKDPSNKDAERLLDSFIVEDVGLGEAKKFNVSIAVRSFYKNNYCDLSKGAGQLRYQAVGEYWKPNKEDLRKLYRFCTNPRDRSMLTLLCSTAIAKETLSNLKWKHLEDNWQEQELPHISLPPELIKGHGKGKYVGVRQETFLTPEAKQNLMEYKQWTERKLGRKFRKEENVYWTLDRPYKSLDYKGIGRIFTALQRNSGVNFSPHDARRFVETTLEEIRISPNWARKIRGRKVRGEEAPYSRPNIEKLREKYREAVSLLEFTTEKAILSEEELRIKSTFDHLRLTGFSDEEIESYKKQRGKTWKTARDLIRIARSVKMKRTETNGGYVNNCHKIVSENELLPLLDAGWEIVKELSNGHIVVCLKT